MNIELVKHTFSTARPFNSIRSGSFIFFRVKSVKGKGLFTVLLNGKTIDVKSSFALVPGEKYKARILKYNSRIELKLEQNTDVLDKMLKNLSLELTGIDREIAEALVKSSVPLNLSNIKIVKNLLKVLKKKDKNTLRLISLMMEKGLPVDEASVHEFVTFYNEFTGERNGNRNYNSRSEEEDDPKDSFKTYALRKDSSRTLLKYFNHRKGKFGDWLLIPFKYRAGSEYSGILRINLDGAKKMQRFTMDVHGKSSWQFSYEKPDNNPVMKVYTEIKADSHTLENKLAKLKEKLHKKGIKIDDIKSEAVPFEAFPSEGGGIPEGVDTVV